MENNSSRVMKKLIVPALLALLTSAKLAFAGSTAHSVESVIVRPMPVIVSLDLNLGQLNTEGGRLSLVNPALLGNVPTESLFSFVGMTVEIKEAHPGVEEARFTKVDNNALVLPRLDQTQKLATVDALAPIKVGFVLDVNDPHGFHALDATLEFFAHVTDHLNQGRVMEAYSASRKAFDGAAASGGVLTLAVPEPPGDAPLTPADALNPERVGMAAKFVRVEPGRFPMGSPAIEKERLEGETSHTVILTHAIEVQKVPATQKQFEAAMGYNPSYFSGNGNGNFPVERVSWFEQVEFANRMSQIAGYEPAYRIIKDAKGKITNVEVNGPNIYETKGYEEGRAGYRPATEAEGEYFTRAGSASAYPWGDDPSGLDEHAWHRGNSDASTHEVGGKKPNVLGLHDTIGNVYEWRHDWYIVLPIFPTTC